MNGRVSLSWTKFGICSNQSQEAATWPIKIFKPDPCGMFLNLDFKSTTKKKLISLRFSWSTYTKQGLNPGHVLNSEYHFQIHFSFLNKEGQNVHLPYSGRHATNMMSTRGKLVRKRKNCMWYVVTLGDVTSFFSSRHGICIYMLGTTKSVSMETHTAPWNELLSNSVRLWKHAFSCLIPHNIMFQLHWNV